MTMIPEKAHSNSRFSLSDRTDIQRLPSPTSLYPDTHLASLASDYLFRVPHEILNSISSIVLDENFRLP